MALRVHRPAYLADVAVGVGESNLVQLGLYSAGGAVSTPVQQRHRERGAIADHRRHWARPHLLAVGLPAARQLSAPQ